LTRSLAIYLQDHLISCQIMQSIFVRDAFEENRGIVSQGSRDLLEMMQESSRPATSLQPQPLPLANAVP